MSVSWSAGSLCFLEAATAKQHGRINDDEYYHHLLAHLASVTHENDIENANKDDDRLRLHDPFAYAVQRVAKGFRDAKDAAPFESIFKTYRTGTLHDLTTQHDSLEAEDAKHIRRLLAVRALLDRRADVLRFCCDKGGFEYDDHFREHANKVSNREHPQTFEVLEASEFRRIYPRGGVHPSAIFDVGGALPVHW